MFYGSQRILFTGKIILKSAFADEGFRLRRCFSPTLTDQIPAHYVTRMFVGGV